MILYYPGVGYPSITHISREAKLSLLSCVSSSSDLHLQKLGLQFKLGKAPLQTNDADYSLLPREQLSSLPTARSLYLKAKHLLFNTITADCDSHLQNLSVQSKFGDSAQMERSCRTWHRLMSGFHPGQLLFLLRAASDTLPTPVNLRRWHVQSDVKCILCDSTRPTTAHILGGFIAAKIYVLP